MTHDAPRSPNKRNEHMTRRTQLCRTESVTADRGHDPSTVSVVLPCAAKFVLLALCFLATTGCRSLRPSDGEGLFARKDLLNTDNIRGPLERAFYEEEDPLQQGQKFSAAGRKQVELARKQFDDRDYRAAAASYKKIADKYAESSIGEEAWFRIGECHFAMKEYPKAQDAYDKLFESYPSTKHVAQASQRMFAIARTWLEVADPETHSQIKTVSDAKVIDDDQPTANANKGLTARYGLLPNFLDETRPLFDTKGRALNALKAIWLNDPTGPLADDALMLTASYTCVSEILSTRHESPNGFNWTCGIACSNTPFGCPCIAFKKSDRGVSHPSCAKTAAVWGNWCSGCCTIHGVPSFS